MLIGLAGRALLNGWGQPPAAQVSLTAISAPPGNSISLALRLGLAEIIFACLFVDLFDNLDDRSVNNYTF